MLKVQTTIITYTTNFDILLLCKEHKINTKCEDSVCPSAFSYLKLLNNFQLSSVLEIFAQGWQVNLSFLSISIPAVHKVQIILHNCPQKVACHTKDWHMT
jgi:hypothetical protein